LNFCQSLDQKTLFAVILAANFLDVKPLLDVTCLHVALKLKSMTPEEIRKEYVCYFLLFILYSLSHIIEYYKRIYTTRRRTSKKRI
jgi:hypothetical protein